MISSSITSGIMQLIFKPQIIIPMIILGLASAVVTELSSFIIERPLSDIILNPNLLSDGNIFGNFLMNYPLEILGILLIGSIMLGIGIIAFMSIARMAKGEGFIDSINSSVMDGAKTLGLIILFWAIFVIVGSAFILASIIGAFESTIGLIVTVIFLIILFIAFVKLIFVFPALINANIKKAFQESWKFTNIRFWGALAMVIVAGIIALIIGLILTQIGIYIGGIADPIFSLLGDSISATYFIAAITNYFYGKQ